ncbi:uncharacterized protein LOC107620192 [Arachis ipaensis]|nr:uncharacterized protein LOC107620192 [Arachis ipaensis]
MSNLQQFVTQYDNCLANKAQQEYELDAASFNTIIPCATASTIEKQFQKEYTHAKFNELQKEFRAKANCFSTKEHEEGYVVTYKVIKEIENGDKMFDVTYKSLVFKKLPNKCILDRWKKTLKRKHSSIKCSHDSSHLEPIKKRYDEMCKQFYNIAEVVVASEELTETVHRILDSVWVMLVKPKASSMDNVNNQNSNEVDKNANDLDNQFF